MTSRTAAAPPRVREIATRIPEAPRHLGSSREAIAEVVAGIASEFRAGC